MSESVPRAHAPISPLLLLVVALAAVAGVSAMWAALSARSGWNCSWMAVLAAIDAALLLRLAGHAPGRSRSINALLITIVTVLAGTTLVAATQLGLGLGMRPAESWSNVSFGLLALYIEANSGWVDAAWVAGASVLAWKAGR